MMDMDIQQRYAVIIDGYRLLVREMEEGLTLPLVGDEGTVSPVGETFDFGDGIPCRAFRTDISLPLAPGYRWIGLRESASLLPAGFYTVAAKGSELLSWADNMRFCGKCGAAMRRNGSISFICEKCGREVFPQLSPAIMVLVKRDDKALLVHAATFKRPFFGLVAGFVETGESLEQCVVREVKEETSLDIKNVRYFGSQSWPFPSQLMVGFIADYAGGELRFADGELTAGGFYSRDSVPPIATPPSLANIMITAWLRGEC